MAAGDALNRTALGISRAASGALALLLVAGMAVLPNVVSLHGYDSFRLPKELAFRLHGIVALVLVTTTVAFGGFRRLREMSRNRATCLLISVVIGWTLLSTATSLNRVQSSQSVITVVCGAALFVTTWYIAPRVSRLVLLIAGVVATVNTVLIFLQNRSIWSPIVVDVRGNDRLAMTGLIGNPNDAAAYLAIVAVVLTACGIQMRGWRRWSAFAAAAVSLAGIGITVTITAAAAAAVAGLVIVAQRSWKALLVALSLAAVAFGVAAANDVPLISRLFSLQSHVSAGRWDLVLSNRLPAFLAAVEMFKDRPLTGVGPGVYKSKEMPYTVEVKHRYDSSAAQSIGVNFGETHNDHLQLLAETGIPGYGLFIGALAFIVTRGREGTRSAGVASGIAVPFVAVTIVLCLASFPLQIAATRHLILVVAGLIFGWTEP